MRVFLIFLIYLGTAQCIVYIPGEPSVNWIFLYSIPNTIYVLIICSLVKLYVTLLL